MPAKSEAAPVANMTAPERADRMVAFLQTAQQRAATRAQAVKEFYSGLSPDQQKVFDSQFHGRHQHFIAAERCNERHRERNARARCAHRRRTAQSQEIDMLNKEIAC